MNIIYKKGDKVKIKNLTCGHGDQHNGKCGIVSIGNNKSKYATVKYANGIKSVFCAEKHLIKL